MLMEQTYIAYQRAKFSTRLDSNRLYARSHFWMQEHDDVWRVGFTKFATRVLGEPVEFDFEVSVEDELSVGQIIGWIEGFKAVTDLFCPMAGRFCGSNPELDEKISLIQTDPYRRGWLYAIKGTPGDDCMNVNEYAAVLDATIDKMMGREGTERSKE